MKVDILASGSSGNCIVIQSNETTILVDAGIAKTKIEKRLAEIGIRSDQIDAIFITHAHGDHIKGLPLANKYRIPVYASEGEWKTIQNVDEELQRVLNPDQCEGIDYEFNVYAFSVYHDAYDPVGYYIQSIHTDDKCSICLDTGIVTEPMLEAMKGSNIIIIEANHEPNMVEESNYPNSVKARVLSHIGHLSNEQTAEALQQLIQGRGEKIYLTHLSGSNNLPTIAEMTVKRALKQKGLIKGKHYEIEVV